MPAFRQIVSELRPQGRLNAGPAPKSLSLEPVAQGATAIVDEELQRRHQEALVNGRTGLNALETRLIHDPEHGAANRRGREALGISKVLLEEVDRETSRIGDTMDDRTRPAFLAMAQARRDQIAEWAARHESREREAVRLQDFNVGLESSKERAAALALLPAGDEVGAARNAASIAAEIQIGQQMVVDHLRRPGAGVSEEAIGLAVKDYTSGVHLGVIKSLVKAGDLSAAQKYVDKHGDALMSKARLDVMGDLKELGVRRDVQAFEDDLIKRGVVGEAGAAEAREKFRDRPEVRDAAVARALALGAQHKAAQAQAQHLADEEGEKIVINGKGRSAIPVDLWNRMSSKSQAWVQNYDEQRWRRAKSDAEGKKHEETPEAHLQYLGALRMATERPAEFAAMSDEALAKYQPLLTPQHYQQLIAMRTGINKDQAKAVQLGKLRKEALALVGSALPELKIKMEGAKRTPTEVARANAFDVALQDAILEAADKGLVDSKELRAITANLLRVGIEQGTGGWFSDPKKKLGFEIDAERASGVAKTYVAKPYDKIPPEQQRALVESLAKTKGLKRSIYGGDYVLTAEDKQEVERMYQRAVEAGRIKP